MREVVVVSAARTPFGSSGGTLKAMQPEELLAVALEACQTPVIFLISDLNNKAADQTVFLLQCQFHI